MGRTLASTAGARGSVCGQGTKVPQAAWCSQKKKVGEEAVSPGVWVVSRKGTVTGSTLKLSEAPLFLLNICFQALKKNTDYRFI